MDILKIQYKPGTVVIDTKFDTRMMVQHFSGKLVYFVDLKDKFPCHDDYITQLGQRYIKDKTYKVLYGR